MQRKGIILAGSKGTRLRPVTYCVSKPLLPVYEKPKIYYPLSVLMQAGIREIAIITTPEDQQLFQRFLGDGSQWGIHFEWIIQPTADAIAQAYVLAEDFLDGAPSALALGDNRFLRKGVPVHLLSANGSDTGGTIFTYEVNDPGRYDVAAFEGNRVTGIVEKPANPPSKCAITGLYFLDASAPRSGRELQPSERDKLELLQLTSNSLHLVANFGIIRRVTSPDSLRIYTDKTARPTLRDIMIPHCLACYSPSHIRCR